jgi:hypothetical protein
MTYTTLYIERFVVGSGYMAFNGPTKKPANMQVFLVLQLLDSSFKIVK